MERIILLKAGEIVVDEEIETLKSRVKKIIAVQPPENLSILSKLDFNNHTEYYVYPFEEKTSSIKATEVVDLNLTEIISAFIGGEYV